MDMGDHKDTGRPAVIAPGGARRPAAAHSAAPRTLALTRRAA
jgi:hypothetical protein